MNNPANRKIVTDWVKNITCFAEVTTVILNKKNLDSMAPACNSRSAVAPDFLPNVPNDGYENEEQESVGVLTASCDQLSPTFDVVARGVL